MKKHFLTIVAMATALLVVMASCNNKKSRADYDDEDDYDDEELVEDDEDDEDEDDADQAFRVKSVKFTKSNADAEMELEYDYPQNDGHVADSVRAYLIGLEGKEDYTGSLRDGQAYINYIGNYKHEMLADEHQTDQATINEDREEGDDPFMLPTYSHSASCSLSDDEPGYVTYRCFTDDYMGGAHGMPYSFGVTFSKADGHRLYNILKNTESSDFHRLVVDGLKSYFNEIGNDGDLDEWLLVPSAEITVPSATPFLTKEGVCFIFGAYEIAPFAAGMPEFTVPYDKIRPFLTKEALRLIDD